jgi:hypothetical protein
VIECPGEGWVPGRKCDTWRTGTKALPIPSDLDYNV